MKFIRFFDDITQQDTSLVGGKAAALGEMTRALSGRGVRIPYGFSITVDAYTAVITYNALHDQLQELLARIDNTTDRCAVALLAQKVRSLFLEAQLPPDVCEEIVTAYTSLCLHYRIEKCVVAVRSSATAEDLPEASFAGQHDSFLGVRGSDELCTAYKKCLASLFNDRAISYRQEKGFDHFSVALSVVVQKMVAADRAGAGVAFTLDPETGFEDVITINAQYGLAELLVQGVINPDEYVVYKPFVRRGFPAIIKKMCGSKEYALRYTGKTTEQHHVSVSEQQRFVLTPAQIKELALCCLTIEEYYSQQRQQKSPMDIEWAIDADDHLLYIVQARPETVRSVKKEVVKEQYVLAPNGSLTVLATGQSIGQKVVTGRACYINDPHDSSSFSPGDIIVTEMTDPDWMPLLRKAGGLVTDNGGRTCHAAIVSRELGLPAIIGTRCGTKAIAAQQEITLDASSGAQGYVYKGNVPFIRHEYAVAATKKVSCDVLVNIADPAQAFTVRQLPVAGVGLARLEFIITSILGIHPMAICFPEQLDEVTRQKLLEKTKAYATPRDFFVDQLACAIATLAAAFYPRPVIVRHTDFKTNEYRDLLGGSFFEPHEENPMLGFRGAARYLSATYAPAFALECEAISYVRRTMGFTNVAVMVPFVRTVREAKETVELLQENNLQRGVDGLSVYMMVEIPSNVILLEEFAHYFDGFSIGSNDLTQLTLGVDRDAGTLAALFDERDPAVLFLLTQAVTKARSLGKYISICGQAPSDYPEVAQVLIEHGINALSLTPDAVLSFLAE